MKKLGICFSGGGARGVAHIGVLRALEENGFYPNHIAGASMGALVGTFYAAGLSPAEILHIFSEATLMRIFRIQPPFNGLAELVYIKEQLAAHIGEDSFAALYHKLFISVTNLTSGENEIINSGRLFDVVQASCAIPLVFKPIEIDGNFYVDGGMLNNFPIQPLLENADKTIGVNVIHHGSIKHKLKHFKSIGVRCSSMIIWQNQKENVKKCNFLVEPVEAFRYGIFDVKNIKHIEQIGYEETMRRMPMIMEMFGEFRSEEKPFRKNKNAESRIFVEQNKNLIEEKQKINVGKIKEEVNELKNLFNIDQRKALDEFVNLCQETALLIAQKKGQLFEKQNFTEFEKRVFIDAISSLQESEIHSQEEYEYKRNEINTFLDSILIIATRYELEEECKEIFERIDRINTKLDLLKVHFMFEKTLTLIRQADLPKDRSLMRQLKVIHYRLRKKWFGWG